VFKSNDKSEASTMKNIIFPTLFILTLPLPGTNTARCADFQLLCGNLIPLNYKNAHGDAEGSSVEILEQIMSKARAPVCAKHCRFEPLARALADLDEKPDTVFMSMAMTEQRKQRYKWVGPIYSMKLSLIARKDKHIRITAPADLERYVIGVIRESAPAQILVNHYGISGKNFVELSRDTQQFGMLKKGRVDLITHTDISAPLVLEHMGLSPEEFEMVFVLKSIDLYFAFNRQTGDALINRPQSELNAMKEVRVDGGSLYMDILCRHGQGCPLPLAQ